MSSGPSAGKGEAALRLVELHRGHADIHRHAVDLGDAGLGHSRRPFRRSGAGAARGAAGLLSFRPMRCPAAIASGSRSKAWTVAPRIEDGAGVAARAEGRVDDDVARLRVERVDHFVQQDGDMGSGARSLPAPFRLGAAHPRPRPGTARAGLASRRPSRQAGPRSHMVRNWPRAQEADIVADAANLAEVAGRTKRPLLSNGTSVKVHIWVERRSRSKSRSRRTRVLLFLVENVFETCRCGEGRMPVRQGYEWCLATHSTPSSPSSAKTLRNSGGRTKRSFSPRSEKPCPLYPAGRCATERLPLKLLSPHADTPPPPQAARQRDPVAPLRERSTGFMSDGITE